MNQTNDLQETLPKENARRSARLVEESVKLTEFAQKLYWLTIILGVFALIRFLIMVLDFCQ